MEAMWENKDPVARFWVRLHNECVDKMINDPEQFLLRHMRHDYKMVREYQKRFGDIFKERGLNLFELIANACGEVWDDEDEEKGGVLQKKVAPMEVKKSSNAVSVDCTRQVGVREGQSQGHELQASDDLREIKLQEGRQGGSGGACAQEETGSPKKKKVREDGGGGVKQHTKGLGNVEEGRLAEAKKPKKRQRKRPALGQAYKIQN